MNFPKELTITEDDLAGDYTDGTDCAIARALIKAGMPREEFGVSAFGRVHSTTLGSAKYEWEDGGDFHYGNLRPGKVVKV